MLVYAYAWQHDLYNSVGFAKGCHEKLESQKTVAEGVLQICCVNRDSEKLYLVSGGAEGNLVSWSLALSPQLDAENEIALLDRYRMDAVPVSALTKVSIKESQQILLVSGSEEGLVTIWHVDTESNSLARLASLTRCSNPVHCLSLTLGLGSGSQIPSQADLRLIVGDDEGGLYIFKPLSSLSLDEPVIREAWEITTELDNIGSSPVAAIVVHSTCFMVGLCEGGIKNVEYCAGHVSDLNVDVKPSTEVFEALERPEAAEEDYEEGKVCMSCVRRTHPYPCRSS